MSNEAEDIQFWERPKRVEYAGPITTDLAELAALREAKGIRVAPPSTTPLLAPLNELDRDISPERLEARNRLRAMSETERAELRLTAQQRHEERLRIEAERRNAERLEAMRKFADIPPEYDELAGTARPWGDIPDDWLSRIWNALACGCMVSLIGPSGFGKTRIACRMAQAWIEAKARSAKFVSWTDYIRARKGEVGGDKGDVFESVANVGLLVLDDIDKAGSTRFVREELYAFVDRRKGKTDRPLILTANTLDVLKPKGAIAEDEAVVADALASRLTDASRALVVPVGGAGWTNWRADPAPQSVKERGERDERRKDIA